MNDDLRTNRRKRSWSQVEPSGPVVVETVPETYAAVLRSSKRCVRRARRQASVSVNRRLIRLYWSIGRELLLRQQNEGWSTKVIDHLAADLRRAFPEMRGFSACNLRYMRTFAAVWREQKVGQQVAKLPWSHIMVLLDAAGSPVEHEWYANQAIQNGWSRNVLARSVADDLFIGKAARPQTSIEACPRSSRRALNGSSEFTAASTCCVVN
jgi:predicted nuclease of restriction endonuclease-like (RecB) superfamily